MRSAFGAIRLFEVVTAPWLSRRMPIPMLGDPTCDYSETRPKSVLRRVSRGPTVVVLLLVAEFLLSSHVALAGERRSLISKTTASRVIDGATCLYEIVKTLVEATEVYCTKYTAVCGSPGAPPIPTCNICTQTEVRVVSSKIDVAETLLNCTPLASTPAH